MEHRHVGRSGLRVSLAGLGCNNFGGRIDEAATNAVVHAALDAGVTLFDTADTYGGTRSEELLGRALGKHRDEVVIATKFGMPIDGRPAGASRSYIMRAVDESLRRLGTDHIDLYQQHVPDPTTPIEETLAALDDLVHAGKVRYLGHSNYSGWQIADADWHARVGHQTRFVSAQNEWSLVRRRVEHEVVPACEHVGLSMLPYFPLAGGLLSGKYQRGAEPPPDSRHAGERGAQWLTDPHFDVVEALTASADAMGRSLGEVALGWLAAQPVVCSVIAGATRPEQVEANAAALGSPLSADELTAVDVVLSEVGSGR